MQKIKVMLEPTVKANALALGYLYNYGSSEWQNLLDIAYDGHEPIETRQVLCLFNWHDEEDIIGEYNGVTGHTYTGELMIVMRSKISDPDANFKVNVSNFLKAKADLLRDSFQQCDGFTVKRWKKIELYDQFDTNLDGVKVQFTIEFKP